MFKHGECLVPQTNHGSMGVSMGNHSNNDSDGNHNIASNDETTSGEFSMSEWEYN